MNLLIDLGNSRLKWGQLQGETIAAQMAVDHLQSDWQSQLFKTWQSLTTPEKLVISSVATSGKLADVIALAKQLWPQIEILLPGSVAQGFGVKNAYEYPQKLGIDRWLCLIAARHFYREAAWIIDCGTAITIDFIDEQGIHEGGLIAPGLTLMKKSLSQNTAALHVNTQAYPTQLANFTEAAIFTGTLYAAVGLIEQALKTKPATAMIVLTGGDAELIRRNLLQHTATIDPDLVLKGLAVFIRQSS
jgi:type III pantothenate kinase